MITAELEFELSSARFVLEKILTLPEALRPTHECPGEDEVGTEIDDPNRLVQSFDPPSSGLGFLKNANGATYYMRKERRGSLGCYAYFDGVSRDVVKSFLICMSSASPIFGFTCAPEEREHRNRVVTKQGMNTIESWVGRDTRKYIPGLYWLTLLPTILAEKYRVSLSVLAGAALEHLELRGEQHLLRFYERPEDWRSNNMLEQLSSAQPGIFDIKKVRLQLETAKNFLEVQAVLDSWD